MTLIFNKKEMKERRRALRKNMTSAEALLWKALRNRRLAGCRFERQYNIGNYIVDFYSPQAKLAIEVDGPIHEAPDTVEYDKVREEDIKGLGIHMLRFKNEEIESRIGGVLNLIAEKIRELDTK